MKTPLTFDQWWDDQVSNNFIGPSRPIRDFARRAWTAAIEQYGIAGRGVPEGAVKPEWISVGDRLPGYEYDGDVLVVGVYSRSVTMRTGRYLTALANEAKNTGEECACTHWMPLPPPPQEQGKS